MKFLLVLTLFIASFTVSAEETDVLPILVKPQGWAINFNFGNTTINSELATQGIDSSAFTFGMSFDYLEQDWYSSILINIVEFDDNFGFSQDVIGTGLGNSGSYDTAKSSASASSIGGAFGKAWFVNGNKSMFYAQAGLNLVVDATRGIDNCSDCYEEDLEVEGGLFTRFGASIYFDNFILGLYTTMALTGDIDSDFGITAGFKY